MKSKYKIRMLALAAAAVMLGGMAQAQLYNEPKAVPDMGKPKQLIGVGIDQKIGSQVPLDLSFRDETGKTVKLGDYFGQRPVLLTMVYYTCPQLCDEVETGIASTLKVSKLDPGRDFNVVSVSFNPKETPADAMKAKNSFVNFYDRKGTGDGLHFLTGDEASIEQLAKAVGFRYTYDAQTGQYYHATGIMFATPKGVLTQYLYGIEYAPVDVRLALVDSSQGKLGTLTDTALLYCFHYDPSTGKYSASIMNIVRAAGALTVLGLGLFMFIAFRREKKEGAAAGR